MFIECFFGPGNGIKLGESPGADNRLQLWIKRFEKEVPFMLPRLHNGELSWYVFFYSKSQAREVRSDLQAFFGNAFATFSSQPYCLTQGDEFDRKISNEQFTNCYRLFVHDKKGFKKSSERMRKIWDEKPKIHRAYKKSIGYLLRDYEIALRVGNEQDALGLIGKIKDTAHLSAENLNYLNIKLLGRMAKWHEITEDENFSDLVSINAPYKIKELLITALYEVHLSAYEDINNTEDAIHRMSELLPRYGALLTNLGSIRAPSALKSFMLKMACSSNCPIPDKIDLILNTPPPGTPDWKYLKKIADGIHQPEITNDLKTFLEIHDYEACYSYLCDKDLDSVNDVQILILAASEIDTFEVVNHTAEMVYNTESEVLEQALSIPFFKKKWTAIQQRITPVTSNADKPPSNWIEWAALINKSDEFCQTAHETAEIIAGEMELSSYIKDSSSVQRMQSELSKMQSPRQKEALKMSFPHLLNFFLADAGSPTPCFKDLYDDFVMFLAIDDSLGGHDLSVLYELTDALLSLGQKEKVLDDLVYFFDTYFSPSNLNWAMDTIDLLIQYGFGSSIVNKGLFTPICKLWNSPSSSKIRDKDKQCIKLLATELGISDTLKTTDKDELNNQVEGSLSSSVIGIYTLTESAGERAKLLISQIYSPKKIEVNTDKAGTDKLKALARNSDIFIMVTSSAKHAATKFIQDNRDRTKPLLYPAGKGSSSIISALSNHLSA